MKGYRTYAAIAATAILQIASALGVDLGVDEQALADAIYTLASLVTLAGAAYFRSRA